MTANVDEVFIDLCRQIIRKDNTTTPSLEEDLVYARRERRPHRHSRRRRDKKGSVCTIL
jgi:Ras-related protein Rap-1B